MSTDKRFAEIPVEAVKNFWNRCPCNLRHSPAPVGTKEYFEEVAKRKFFVEPHLVDFADFPSVKGKKVLEIGCGLGTTAVRFAMAGAAKVTAVDISEQSLELAKQHAAVYGVSDRMEFFLANAEELSKHIPLDHYDVIFSFGVIHHTPHPDKIIQELKHFLKRNGKIKIMVYSRYCWKTLWVLFKHGKLKFWNLSKLLAAHSEAQIGCPVTYTYSRSSGRKLLESHGFKVDRVHVDHIFPYKIAEYVQYKYVKIWYFRWMPRRLFRWLETKFGWHLCIEASR
ncbi:MAG: methyltransferase domain-containing protein [Verrucomicrobia bacterium]|nr:methyltransferase domain-containing protein [Verrucomicrobiota bacterium]MBU6446590.1 methyltransferase domain-containing protein [Verrucomicrobiota bacterium]MDE3047632.1 methyltransferase domain-containing protein [Verrucomicrobiota bacterium]